MLFDLPQAGQADTALAQEVSTWWLEAAEEANVDLTGFDPEATASERVAWAKGAGLEIACVYSRFSSKRQHSTDDQVRTCVQFAAENGMYVPPEVVCVDEGVTGRRIRRVGLERLKTILQRQNAAVLLVFKASRLFRRAYEGFQLIQEQVVEEGLRAISVTQGVDTADGKTWKMTLQFHGMMDEMFLEATADHVRAGQRGLFRQGCTTGALPVGYRRKEVEGPLTNRGLPRTVPEVDPEAAELILQHYRWIRDGMTVREGWRRWNEAGGPTDPRSPHSHTGYRAYRRMLSNPRYTGRWEFGRTKSQFSSKRDYVRQIEQPDSEVETYQCEELRIVDDELFYAVQQRLQRLKGGPHKRRKPRPTQLWDMVVDLFRCAACGERFYVAGAHGQAMQCKRAGLCPCKVMVNREEAVRAVCERLQELIAENEALVCDVVLKACELDARGDEELRGEIDAADAMIAKISRRIDDLTDLLGQGSDEDRRQLKAKIRAAQSERSALQLERTRLDRALSRSAATITPDDVRRILGEFAQLMKDAGDGSLGEEAIYKAATVFRQLVGDRIEVCVEPRPGRKRPLVRGKFRSCLVRAVRTSLDVPGEVEIGDEQDVWLRKPPRMDRYAEQVRRMYEEEQLSFREIGERLDIGCAGAWQAYQRYYETVDRPMPPKRPNRRPRKSA